LQDYLAVFEVVLLNVAVRIIIGASQPLEYLNYWSTHILSWSGNLTMIGCTKFPNERRSQGSRRMEGELQDGHRCALDEAELLEGVFEHALAHGRIVCMNCWREGKYKRENTQTTQERWR
jgi:hypothetical protein